jgi:hypothetical protein
MADWVSVIAATRSWAECTAGERARAGSDGEPLRAWLATGLVTPEHIQVLHLRRVILAAG